MSETKQPSLHVGRLATVNEDPYPDLGTWWVQIWDTDRDCVLARVYGDTPDEARDMAKRIVRALSPTKETEHE